VSISTIKADLDEIAKIIREQRNKLLLIEPALQSAYDKLDVIPTYFQTTIQEINNLPTSSANDVYKDERQQMTQEYNSLRTAAQDMINAISSITI
jgi:AAA+ ATPase superfamily predicted ATPase